MRRDIETHRAGEHTENSLKCATLARGGIPPWLRGTTVHHLAPSPSGHPLLSGPSTSSDIHQQIFTLLPRTRQPFAFWALQRRASEVAAPAAPSLVARRLESDLELPVVLSHHLVTRKQPRTQTTRAASPCRHVLPRHTGIASAPLLSRVRARTGVGGSHLQAAGVLDPHRSLSILQLVP